MITGNTSLIAHIGWPTQAFRALAISLRLGTGSNGPAGFGLVVNVTLLGMNDDDPRPVDVSRIEPEAFVGEVVMKRDRTAFVQAASVRGYQVQVGTDMLFAQIPAYLEFFGLPSTTPQQLRTLCRLDP